MTSMHLLSVCLSVSLHVGPREHPGAAFGGTASTTYSTPATTHACLPRGIVNLWESRRRDSNNLGGID